VQTAGEALNFNPHLHGLLADGTLDASGKFTPLAVVGTEALTRHRGLIIDDDVAQILAQEHTGFGAWVGEPFEEPDRTKFVARYIERGPISLEKLTIQDDIITYTTKDERVHSLPRRSLGRRREFDALEFLALLSCHIPKPYESITRYYGWYSCRARGERAKRKPTQNSPPLEPAAGRPSLSWAQCFKRVYEINPLECPKCKGEMRIIAFVTNQREVSKIADSLGIPHSTAPPPIPRAPQQELFDEIPHNDFS
jgi:hypothetical protein